MTLVRSVDPLDVSQIQKTMDAYQAPVNQKWL